MNWQVFRFIIVVKIPISRNYDILDHYWKPSSTFSPAISVGHDDVIRGHERFYVNNSWLGDATNVKVASICFVVMMERLICDMTYLTLTLTYDLDQWSTISTWHFEIIKCPAWTSLTRETQWCQTHLTSSWGKKKSRYPFPELSLWSPLVTWFLTGGKKWPMTENDLNREWKKENKK